MKKRHKLTLYKDDDLGKIFEAWYGENGWRKAWICERGLRSYFEFPRTTRGLWLVVSDRPFEGAYEVNGGMDGVLVRHSSGNRRRLEVFLSFEWLLRHDAGLPAWPSDAGNFNLWVGLEYKE